MTDAAPELVDIDNSIPEVSQERYIHWKKNTKLLYDYLNTNATKWPSLTCQFFPDLDTSTDSHRILLSSFTSSQLPEDEAIYISKISTLDHIKWSSLNNFDMDEMEFKPDNSTKFPSKNLYNDLTVRFPGGDCNRARYLPQNPDVILAASSDGSIYVFNRTKHGTTASQSLNSTRYAMKLSSANKSQDIVQVDETNETVSISCNGQKEGLLASCYSQGQLKVWDISAYSHADPIINQPVISLNDADPKGLNDVSWMPLHDSLIAACGESNYVALHDTRSSELISQSDSNLHQGGINACKFNPHNSLLLASGDAEGTVNLWDLRKLDKAPIKSLQHGSAVSTLEWSPNLEPIIATAGQNDGLVKIWDASTDRVIFTHGGHMLGVNDIAWNAHDPWLLCSVANDNSVHVWRPARHLVELQ
ncbi:hypothetical protein HG535_0A05680 [Zygotorulaspora mrakii]|uniref:Uncharacterized protein n=1 Tax=Zygotorulaspora mrakii TaxID=42260 RepID=A0A7H9AWV9_ZYGMR|nr:uncharacterized protein HG535_0A05680 [Zygotorulaspora mrakii]QLG70627.1 hypothetical protein HG535_0A05680 [Zygotorulaspora mrakii]